MFFSIKNQKPVIKPELLYETSKFILKLASTKSEIEKAYRLRYQIFNIEKGLGQSSSARYELDFDQFDELCSHLIVLEKSTRNVVGTYRINLPKDLDRAPKAFYSAREYDIVGLDDLADQTMEVGRTCVAPDYRTGTVIALLWSGIGKLLKLTKFRYLLGCVSLDVNDPVIAWALYKHFKLNGRISKILFAYPRKYFAIEKPPDSEIRKILDNKELIENSIPPLLKAYFRIGANVCGEPVADKEFKTLDFLISVDTKHAPERYTRRFLDR